MPRTGDTYALPSNYLAVTGEAATAAQHNDPLEDLRDEQNLVRPVAHGGTGGSSASAARTALGLEIGSDVQAYDAGLQSIAGLTTAADKMVYTTASDTYAVADLTSAGRALLDDADASAQRTTLGLGTAAVVDVIDEDDMSTDSATRPPSQQSVKAYVDASVATLGTAAATTSGTSHDKTSLAAGLNRIEIMMDAVSTDGSSNLQIQIGDSGGIEATGYTSGASWSSTFVSSTTGFLVTHSTGASATWTGVVTLVRMTGNKWAYSAQLRSTTTVSSSSGVKELSGELDRIRLTTVNGTDTFDAGSWNELVS